MNVILYTASSSEDPHAHNKAKIANISRPQEDERAYDSTAIDRNYM